MMNDHGINAGMIAHRGKITLLADFTHRNRNFMEHTAIKAARVVHRPPHIHRGGGDAKGQAHVGLCSCQS